MTRAEIRHEIRKLLNDAVLEDDLATALTTNPNPRFSDTILNRRINYIYKKIANKTKVLKSSAERTIATETREYALPIDADILEVDKVELIDRSGTTDDHRDLFPITQEELAMHNRNWKNTVGSPSRWWLRGKLVGLYPNPSEQDNGKTLRVEYGQRAQDLDDDSDTPEFGEQYHDIILWGVVEWCKKEDNDWQESAMYGQMFLNELARMKAEQDARVGKVHFLKNI